MIGPYVYTMTKDGEFSHLFAQPRNITQVFGLPANIDAAFTRPNNISYFFKVFSNQNWEIHAKYKRFLKLFILSYQNDLFWRFSNDMKMDYGYPKKVSEFFPGIPTPIDAALVLDNKIYFFIDDLYYKFDHTRIPFVSEDYPKHLKDWHGLYSGGVDAAVKFPGDCEHYSYFFKGDTYMKFYDKAFHVRRIKAENAIYYQYYTQHCKISFLAGSSGRPAISEIDTNAV